jgi:hypothetical protein
VAGKRYEDVVLLVERVEGPAATYRAQVLDSPAGSVGGHFSLEAEPQFAALLEPDESEAAPAAAGAAALGRRLYESIFGGEIGECLRRSSELARGRQAALRLRLRLHQAPELARLPWELLYDARRAGFLLRDLDATLVREPEPEQASEAPVVHLPLRVLVLAASPLDQPPLQVDREWEALRAALAGLQRRGLVLLERLEEARLSRLRARLRQGEYHVLHVVGHGRYDPRAQSSVLLLEDERDSRASRETTAAELARLLVGHHSLRLAVLNVCEGARGGPDPYAGTAQTLVRRGVPAAIGMQFSISDGAALEFAAELYRALADGVPLEAALTDARNAVSDDPESVEWCTPVLYSRTADSRLFDLRLADEAACLARTLDLLSTTLRAARADDDWPRAVQMLETLQEIDPARPGIEADLVRAYQMREASRLFNQAEISRLAGQRESALESFRQAYRLGGVFRRVVGRIAELEAEMGLRQAGPAGGETPRGLAPHDQPDQYQDILDALAEGKLVPLIGSGVHLAGRPPAARFEPRRYPPSSDELAAHLREIGHYPTGEASDLARIAEYISVMRGPERLKDELHALFDQDFPPGPVHRFFAELPALLRGRGQPSGLVLASTSYDDVLERAFQEAGEPFDLVVYQADGPARGRFLHRGPDGEVRPILVPNEYVDLALDRRPVILKINGLVDRLDPSRDSCVITEEHFIDYLARTDLANLVPKELVLRLRRSHFLILGFSLRDWGLRVVLQRIWNQERPAYNAWALQPEAETHEREFWLKRNVHVLPATPEAYVAGLRERLR